MDYGKLRICFDRIVTDSASPARAEQERAAISHAHAMMSLAGPRGLDATEIGPIFRAAIVDPKKWENGRVLKCRFLDGSKTQRKRVEGKAHIWEKYANIKFQFVTTTDEDIRITFGFDAGSWSAVGTDALIERYFPKHQPTMNYGWLEDDTRDDEYERVVVHEFGHAIGLIHEHQNPNAKLKWNKPVVYRVFSGSPNFWSKPDIDSNILDRYSPRGITATSFDDKSIMLYQFDAGLFLDRKPTPSNTRLSDRDKTFIARMYPKP
jgi:serralysin